MTANITTSPAHNFSDLKSPPSTIICREKTVILGDVTIGSDCVIHPTVNIVAKNGPIIIGNNNLIEERVSIVNNRHELMVIGDDNVFEVDSSCEAIKIGNHNILESKSSIGANIELADNCIIGAGCVISNYSTENHESKVKRFPSHTVISGQELNERVVSDLPTSTHVSQLDFLRKILPNYQKLWRPSAQNLPSTPQAK